jgi:hypothetical protein
MTNVHVFTESHDTLPSIAETYGHSGEWLTLWMGNDYIADPAAIYPGMEIEIPDEWTTDVTPTHTHSSSRTDTSSSSSRAHTRERDD